MEGVTSSHSPDFFGSFISVNSRLQRNAEIRKSEIRKMPKSQCSPVLSLRNLNWAYLDALFALARPVGQVVEFGIQTAVQNPDN